VGIIRGRFYLKKTSNGNLVGEFSNDYGLYTESADWEDGCNINKFEGTYHSTWREGTNSRYAKLEIKYEEFTKLFNLSWETKRNTSNFEGKAMLRDGILVGDYESVTSLNKSSKMKQ